MPTVEERLAYLEGRVQEYGHGMEELRGALLRLDGRMDGLDQKIDRFREELARRIDGVDHRISRGFFWVVGMQLTVLLAIVGTLLQVTR